jgi:hypothetical protein
MLPLLLGAIAGGLLVKNMTGYPSEIRKLQGQMPKDEREDFIRDYKSLPSETKNQFKQYLREANLVEASKLIGKDLSGYAIKATQNANQIEQKAVENSETVTDAGNGFTERIKNILNAAQFEFDPQLVVEASKAYDKIGGYNSMSIVDKTQKMLDVSQ